MEALRAAHIEMWYRIGIKRLTKRCDVLVALGLDPSLAKMPKLKRAFDILPHVECHFLKHHGKGDFLLTQVKKERSKVMKTAPLAVEQLNVGTKQAAQALLELAGD
jgi:hypothetical protein